jgi:histidinol-phosphate aminotransferase
MKPCPDSRTDYLEPYQPGKPIETVQRELGLKRVVKLASNENPLGPSPKALRAMRAALNTGHLYPDGACGELRKRLARFWNLAPDWFAFGNGSNELLVLAAQAYCGPKDRAVFSGWSFVVYKTAALLVGARFVEVKDDHFTHDLAALARASRSAKLLFLCNPNNPTGSWHPPLAMERTLAKISGNCLVVLDEAYAEYCGQTVQQDRAWVRRFPNLMICRTFSKIYGMAGLRLGYAVARPEIIRIMERVRQPFNANRIAQAGAVAALDDHGFLRKTQKLNNQGLQELGAYLKSRGAWFAESWANFLFFKPSQAKPLGGDNWFDFLQAQGVIIRPMPHGYFRVTTGTGRENNLFMRSFDKGLGLRKG